METYQRRKYRNTKETYSVDENLYCNDRDQSRLMGTVSPPLARHGFAQPSSLLPASDCSPHLSHSYHLYYVDHCIQMVAVGSLYEIDHIHLPHRTPVQLRSIRVAMVSEKTPLNLAVRFPSIGSLKTYFHNSAREMYPELDEKFVMGTTLASKVLFRQIPSHEFAEKKHLVGFWLVNSAAVDRIVEDTCSNQGGLLSALTCNGMIRWGARRQVKFLEKHKDNVIDANSDVSSESRFLLSAPKVSEEENMEEGEGQQEDDNEEENEEVGEEEEEDEESEAEEFVDEKLETEEMNGNGKRKRYMLRHNSSIKKEKENKCEKIKKKKPQANKNKNKCRDLVVFQNPKDRWSAERYKLATKNLMEVMKVKKATACKPIIRPDLRAEARKLIGDTGLLDHLLKHMAGKLAPDGEHRFRRRHNADGAMEYWLESADLVDIRKKAGVIDPYWTPPPGWKPGDSPNQDPVCAKELRLLKEELLELKRKSQETVPRKLFEEELTKLKREYEKLASGKMQNQAAEVLPVPVSISQKLDLLANSLVSSKSHIEKEPAALQIYEQQLMAIYDLAKGIEQMHEQQLMVISDLAKGIEQEMKKLLSNGKSQGETRTDSASFIVSKESTAQNGIKKLETEQKSKEENAKHVSLNEGERSTAMQVEKTANTASTSEIAEEKAARIQRLKSGFRICKPQGTFLWPNMARPGPPQPHVVVQVEDLFMVPTPPSVSSSTGLFPPQLPNSYRHPTSPVKPLAERRAVTVTVSTSADGHNHQNFSTTTTTTTTTSTTKQPNPINLNDVPSVNPNEGFCDNPSTQQTITPIGMPRLLPDSVIKNATWDNSSNSFCGAKEETGQSGQKQSNCCSSSASCLSSGVGNWLALATTTNSASDESSQG